jgi:hypothetical protein
MGMQGPQQRSLTTADMTATMPEFQRTGERYCEMVTTSFMVADTPPYGRMQVVSYLKTLLDREPVRSDPWYAAHRLIIGSIISDLEGYAIRDGADGIQPPTLVDVRDPATVAKEREWIAATTRWARERQAASGAAYSAHIDTLLAESEAGHLAADERLGKAVASATEADEQIPVI